MNTKTFYSKEFLLYAIPAMIVDLALCLAIYYFELSVFKFYDPADRILNRPRTLYFLVVGYLIASATVPTIFYKRGVRPRDIVLNAFLLSLFTIGIMAVSVDVLFSSFAGRFYLQQGIATTAAISIWHLFFRWVINTARKNGRNKIHVVIVGSDTNAVRLYDTLTKYNYDEYKILGFFTDKPHRLPSGSVQLGGLADVDDYIHNNKVHNLYCSLNPAIDTDKVNDIIRQCDDLFIEFYYVPNMDGYLHRKMHFDEIGHVTVVKLREEPLANPVNAAFKRCFDIVFSALVLCLIYPFVWIFVAIGTKITSPGPILFRQQRTGYRGQSFMMLKFRSMKVNADADKLQATEDDPRKTKFGDFLRRSSIDELPQFINVFKGDMSVIGPRPHMEKHTEMYNSLVEAYMVRHMVKPGLTGLAQVNGCRGETKQVHQMAERVRYDIWYIENWSVWMDIKIFIKTILQIFGGDKQAY